MSEKVKSLLSKWKAFNHKEILTVVLLGSLLFIIFFSSLGKLSNSNSSTKTESFSVNTYVSDLENRMEKILSQIDGAGQVMVMITVSSGMESVPYLKEDGTIASSGGKVVVLREEFPKAVGVVIVAEGAQSYVVKSQMLTATVSLLNVSADKVQIYTKTK